MQTFFSPEQLADPKIAEADGILRACVHCGFCTATCPTYVELGDELDSPRGRIYLIKDMLEKDRPPTRDDVTHIDRCLSCLSCMTTCPAGVHYGHLVDHARVHIEKTYKRPLFDRLFRDLLANVLPHPRRFRLALVAAVIARPLAGLFVGPLRPLAAMLRLAPAGRIAPPLERSGKVYPAEGRKRARVAMLLGCVNPVLAPSTIDATIRVLNRHGVEVVTAPGEECCGSLTHHMGRDDEARAQARRTIDGWTREIDDGGLDAIVVNVSGCGATVKDYGHMFREEPAYAGKAARISALARDVAEYLAGLGIVAEKGTPGLTVAYHAACSLQHGQGIRREPAELLERAGFTVRPIPEGHLCCGSAGTYNILQPEIAARLRDRKVANIRSVAPDVIASGNIGCITQIASGIDVPVVHTVELLDWATGGPVPAALAARG